MLWRALLPCPAMRFLGFKQAGTAPARDCCPFIWRQAFEGMWDHKQRWPKKRSQVQAKPDVCGCLANLSTRNLLVILWAALLGYGATSASLYAQQARNYRQVLDLQPCQPQPLIWEALFSALSPSPNLNMDQHQMVVLV